MSHEETAGASEYDSTLGSEFPLRLLLAEDNSVNQKLALLILERIGYRADIAANGLEALDAVKRQPYDVVLMDMQMPEMDGLQATGAIRTQLQADCQPHIIAMTANAMPGDREMCLAAGMNDFVSKPIAIRELVAALRRAPRRDAPPVSANERSASEGERPPEPDGHGVLSDPLDPAALQQLREALGPQASAMLPGLIASFFASAAEQQAGARQALQEGNAADLRRAAHTLKSNARSFGATRLGELCLALEERAEESNLADADHLLSEIEAECAAAKAALEAVREGAAGGQSGSEFNGRCGQARDGI